MDKPEPPYSLATQEPTCSFCDQPASKVKKLIAGKRGLHICNYCVALCYDVLTAEGAIDPPLLGERGLGEGIPACSRTAAQSLPHQRLKFRKSMTSRP